MKVLLVFSFSFKTLDENESSNYVCFENNECLNKSTLKYRRKKIFEKIWLTFSSNQCLGSLDLHEAAVLINSWEFAQSICTVAAYSLKNYGIDEFTKKKYTTEKKNSLFSILWYTPYSVFFFKLRIACNNSVFSIIYLNENTGRNMCMLKISSKLTLFLLPNFI